MMNTILLSFFLAAGLAMATGAEAQQSADNESVLIHTVYFWLNDDVSEADYQNFYHELKTLEEIPTVIQGWVAVPAGTEQRGVIDHTYDYSITFIFADEQAEADYQVHPIHTDFLDKNSQLWDRVVVYDAITP